MRRSSIMRIVLLPWAGMLAVPSMAALLDPPSLRCASVDAVGNVTLTWVVPPDPNNDFLQYVVHASSAFAGPYVVAGTLNVYGLNTFTHVGAGADAGPRYYYLTTLSVDTPPNESVPSDTLATMFLTVTQSTPLGSAVLDWNLPHVPPIPTADDQVSVQLEYPLATWSQVAAVDGTHYQQVISICDDSLTYRIALADQLGCVSYSSLAGDVFQDVTAPTPPVMVTVSVDTATNQTVLTWDPSPEGDTDGYIIVYLDGGNNYIIDTIYGQNNTSYVWTGSNAGLGSETYTVAAFDTCYSGNPAAPNTSATNPAHTTIFTSTTYDRCNAVIHVHWTGYVGWPVSNYQLYATENGGAPYLLGTFGPNASNFQDTGVDPFASYCYMIRATGSTPQQVAIGNLSCRFTDYPPVPQWNYLRVATVVDEDHVTIVDSVDQSASVKRYRLERTFNGGPWENVATQAGGLGSTVVFDDLDTQTHLRSYIYRVIVEDSCGNDVITSNEGTSMLLIAEPGLDGINRLHWNGYGDWAGTVSGYAVYRSIGGAPYSPIAFNASNDWDLDDDVSDFTESNGLFCYYVEAIEVADPSGFDAVSTSNEACAVQQEEVWIPSAFIAGSSIHENSHFQPVLAFVDVNGYEFTIYNRWGQQIWTTSDPYEPWKGVVNGNYVPQGVYAYYCAFYNGAGKKFEQRGTVTFLCCP